MRVAVLGSRGIENRYSGVEVSIYEISKRLSKKGYTFIVYCRKQERYASQKTTKKNGNIQLVYIPTIESKHLGTFIHVLLSLFHLLFMAHTVDIVHFHALGPSVFSILPRLFGKKTIVTVHGLDWKRNKWKLFAKLFLKVGEYTAIKCPHKTIVVSKELEKYYEQKYRGKVIYIPNGASLPSHQRHRPDDIVRDKIILYVGRLTPEKGIHYLIKAFNELDTDAQLFIVGSSSFTDRYVNYLKSLKKANITFLGSLTKERLDELYAAAYIFVLPSEIEGTSISLLEAMSYGAGVIVSDIPECIEVIDDCGVTFKTKDYHDLKAKLSNLLKNPTLVHDIGVKAQKRVLKEYNWDTITNKMEAVYCACKQPHVS